MSKPGMQGRTDNSEPEPRAVGCGGGGSTNLGLAAYDSADAGARDSVSGPVARWWHQMQDGRIQCDLCPRQCRLHAGQRGLCFVRGRPEVKRGTDAPAGGSPSSLATAASGDSNSLVLTTYGRSSGFCIDPIEKKPLNHFLPGTPVLSFGTAGCNLTCKFCQNWDISKSRDFDRLADSATPTQIAAVARELGCASIAFTYNDPVIFAEYAIDAAIAAQEAGIKTVAVTAGYISPTPRAEFFSHMDAANIDLKAFSEQFYHRVCGAALAPILETIEYVTTHSDTWVELTTLLIPGYNDSDDELDQMTRWVVDHCGPDVPMHFSAFHPDWKMRDVPATPAHTLTRAREIAMVNGVRFAYTGNVHDRAGDTTFCSGCGYGVIVRDWYRILRYDLNRRGCCARCGAKIPGVFNPLVGDWGARRVPVSMSRR